jgi:hypothetical protein
LSSASIGPEDSATVLTDLSLIFTLTVASDQILPALRSTLTRYPSTSKNSLRRPSIRATSSLNDASAASYS